MSLISKLRYKWAFLSNYIIEQERTISAILISVHFLQIPYEIKSKSHIIRNFWVRVHGNPEISQTNDSLNN